MGLKICIVVARLWDESTLPPLAFILHIINNNRNSLSVHSLTQWQRVQESISSDTARAPVDLGPLSESSFATYEWTDNYLSTTLT